jgi:hypothetical protein
MKRTLIAVYITLTLACASGGTPEARQTAGAGTGTGSVPQGTPLGFLVGRPLLILPIQRNVAYPDPSWMSRMGEGYQFLPTVDQAIESALSTRGLGNGWTFSSVISASARRNTGLVPDPHAVAVGNLVRLTKAGDDPVSEPLATQIRQLVALREGRYSLIPAALVFENAPTTMRAKLILYLIDSRTARITWSGEVRSDPAPVFSAAMANSLAEHVADLVVAR